MKNSGIPNPAADAGPVPQAPTSTNAVESVKPLKTRSNFPETWVWQLLEAEQAL